MKKTIIAVILIIAGILVACLLVGHYYSWFYNMLGYYDFMVYDIDLKWNGVKSYGYFMLKNAGSVDIVGLKVEVIGYGWAIVSNPPSPSSPLRKYEVMQVEIEDLGVYECTRVTLSIWVEFANGREVVKLYSARIESIVASGYTTPPPQPIGEGGTLDFEVYNIWAWASSLHITFNVRNTGELVIDRVVSRVESFTVENSTSLKKGEYLKYSLTFDCEPPDYVTLNVTAYSGDKFGFKVYRVPVYKPTQPTQPQQPTQPSQQCTPPSPDLFGTWDKVWQFNTEGELYDFANWFVWYAYVDNGLLEFNPPSDDCSDVIHYSAQLYEKVAVCLKVNVSEAVESIEVFYVVDRDGSKEYGGVLLAEDTSRLALYDGGSTLEYFNNPNCWVVVVYDHSAKELKAYNYRGELLASINVAELRDASDVEVFISIMEYNLQGSYVTNVRVDWVAVKYLPP